MKKIASLLFVLCFITTQAQTKDPLLTKDKKAQEKWVNNILNKMTNEEKLLNNSLIVRYSL